MPERIILAIGTRKGLFVAEAPKARRGFALRGPFGPGVAVYSALIDTRGTPRIYASSCNAFFASRVTLTVPSAWNLPLLSVIAVEVCSVSPE